MLGGKSRLAALAALGMMGSIGASIGLGWSEPRVSRPKEVPFGLLGGWGIPSSHARKPKRLRAATVKRQALKRRNRAKHKAALKR